ncbi:MAG: RHS repeat protein, partial [Myxococcaceae bacterium]|nr:RHS repeat protein [Myxococcaceae bacterium]
MSVTSPLVPGPALTAPPATWVTQRSYELTGQLAREVDGNGHSSSTDYDGFGRPRRLTDAVGRSQERTFDANGNLTREAFTTGSGSTAKTHRLRETTYDALNRALDSRETVAQLGGATVQYLTSTRYSDVVAQHLKVTRDARGFLTTTPLDDLGRPYLRVVDDAPSLGLSRPSGAPAPLQLRTAFSFDGNGARLQTRDARGHVTTELFDGLQRLARRELPLGYSEIFAYDGAGNRTAHVDVRGVRRETTRDALGRERKATL